MFTILAIIVALVGCLWGVKKGFISAWILLFNVMFAAYLSVMFVAMTGKYFPESLPNQWAKAGDFLFTAVFLFVILHALSIHFFDDLAMPDLPKYFDIAGAGLCGFIAGYLVFWILIYSIALTPIGEQDFMKSKNAGDTAIVHVGRGKIDALSNVLECLSLQEDDKQSEKLFLWLETPKAKFIKKTAAAECNAKAAEAKPKTSSPVKSPAVKAKAADPNSEPNKPAVK